MELLVLGLVAGIGFASYALWQRARKDEDEAERAERKRLQAPVDRSPTTMQVGDVVQHLGTDYLVEGVVTMSEDGRGSRLYRMFDGVGERFLYAKSGASDPLLLSPAALALDSDAPPETVAFEGTRYRQTARATAQAVRVGQLGPRKQADRVRIYEYSGPGPARLLVVDWGDRVETFVGERVLGHALDILPAR
jgi:uncharacterized protein DUF4178